MEINGIQTGIFPQTSAGRTIEQTRNTYGGMAALGAQQNTTGSTDAAVIPQALGIIQGINYLQDQLKDLINSYPPFFPAGHPSRPDMIKQIRSMQASIKESGIISGSSTIIPANASDKEVSAALGSLNAVKDTLTLTKGISPEDKKPGDIISIKV